MNTTPARCSARHQHLGHRWTRAILDDRNLFPASRMLAGAVASRAEQVKTQIPGTLTVGAVRDANLRDLGPALALAPEEFEDALVDLAECGYLLRGAVGQRHILIMDTGVAA